MSDHQQNNPVQEHRSPQLSPEGNMLSENGFGDGFDAIDGSVQSPPAFQLAASSEPIQRKVRVNNGKTKVQEKDYQKGGKKETVGSRYKVADLIADKNKRIFTDVQEMEDYANGKTDHIGDVVTESKDEYWYRLPKNQLTVLGEIHHNDDGNVPNVIAGLQTSRFVYEPHHEFTAAEPFDEKSIGDGTQKRIHDIEKNLETGPYVDRKNFDPHLENIVIKAMTGTALARNRFLAADPPKMTGRTAAAYKGRATKDDYSIGDRIALYVSMAIHIAQDISKYPFGPEVLIESNYYNAGRKLKEYYLKHQKELDTIMTKKDKDDLVGIYELCEPDSWKVLPTLEKFTLLFHEYGARYIEKLGSDIKNKTLEQEGTKLAGNLKADLSDMNTAREEIMWQRVLEANSGGYLIAGMGDAHRRSFVKRLKKEGIPQEETVDSLKRQKKEVKSAWVD